LQDGAGLLVVHHGRREQCQARVVMFFVVPTKKSLRESATVLNAAEAVGKLGTIFHGAELRSGAPTVVVKVEPFQSGSQSCGCHQRRSYSDHDTQKCVVAGSDRDDIDDGSFSVDVCPHLPQCSAERGSCRHAVPVIHLCVWLLQRDGVLLCSSTCSTRRSRRDFGRFFPPEGYCSDDPPRESILGDSAAGRGFGVAPAFQSMLRGFWASLMSVPHGHHCLLLLPKSPIGLIDVQLVLRRSIDGTLESGWNGARAGGRERERPQTAHTTAHTAANSLKDGGSEWGSNLLENVVTTTCDEADGDLTYVSHAAQRQQHTNRTHFCTHFPHSRRPVFAHIKVDPSPHSCQVEPADSRQPDIEDEATGQVRKVAC
jgi:hypothetical protein